MARPNFDFKKRQKEMARERKRQEKAQKKLERSNARQSEPSEAPPADGGSPQGPNAQ